MITSEIQAELNAVPGLMKLYAAPLFTRRGYKYDGTTTLDSKIVADGANLIFSNDRAGRRIDVTYFPPCADRRRSFTIIFFNRAGNTFILTHYLRAHRREDVQASLHAEAHNPDLRVYWDDFFRKLDQLFDTELKDIVEGRRWEDVPFDWQGYK